MAHLIHQTRDGERWDQLAHRYYGDVGMQGTLIAANRGLFLATLTVPPVLSAGLTIKVPIYERPSSLPAALLPPWKQAPED